MGRLRRVVARLGFVSNAVAQNPHPRRHAGSLIWVADQCASFSTRCSHSVYSAPTGLSFVVRTAPDCALPAGICQPSLGLKRTFCGRQSCPRGSPPPSWRGVPFSLPLAIALI